MEALGYWPMEHLHKRGNHVIDLIARAAGATLLVGIVIGLVWLPEYLNARTERKRDAAEKRKK